MATATSTTTSGRARDGRFLKNGSSEHANGSHVEGGVDKVKRYGWQVLDEPGEFRQIHKDKIRIDPTYQREAGEAKVLAIAAKWSWVACGAIIVADRNGELYAIEGGHRVLGARRRSDITTLPCMVYRTESIKEEAGGFLRTNTLRRPLTSLERFRAQIVDENDAALLLQKLLDESQFRPSKTTQGGKVVKCVGVLLAAIERDRDTFERIWPLVIEVANQGPILERVFSSIMWLEQQIEPTGKSLTREPWKSRIVRLGSKNILDATARAASYHARGGAKIWGEGLMDELNKGMRNRLRLVQSTDDEGE